MTAHVILCINCIPVGIESSYEYAFTNCHYCDVISSVVSVADTKKNDERKIYFLLVFISAQLPHFWPSYAV